MLTRRKNQQDAKNNLIPVDEEDHVSEDVSSLNRYIIPVPVDGYGLILFENVLRTLRVSLIIICALQKA